MRTGPMLMRTMLMRTMLMRRLWIRALPTLMLALAAVPSLAMMGWEPVQETEESIGTAIPEPGALLLFAAGALLVVWTVRRRRATS